MSRSVKVILGGGLGNQMFMYAAGRALAVRMNARLVLDLSEFRRDVVYKRVYLLGRFSISAAVLPSGVSTWLRWTFDRAIRKAPALAERWGFYDEPVVDGMQVFDLRLLSPPDRGSISLRGYWQSEAYFRDYADVIRRELTPEVPRDAVANAELAKIQASAHPVSVGVRFFRETPDGGLNPAETLSAFREQLVAHAAANPGCDYFVFSDEPRHLADSACLGVPFTLITPRPRNEDAPVDLYLMSQCRTFFLGYSSFHWWGAWLAAAPDKQVTYLQFPGRPSEGYAANGWRVVTANAHL